MKGLVLAASTAVLLAAPAAMADSFMDHVDSAEVFAGLGFGNYDKDLGNFTTTGLAWNIRAGVDAYRYLGAELSYLGFSGGVNNVTAPNGILVSGSNATQAQFTADLKAGYPFMVADRTMRPYALVGLGYSHVGINDNLNPAGLQSFSSVAIPLGVGVSYKLTEAFAVDGRFMYNILNGNHMPAAPTGDSWTLGVNIGAKFGG